MIKKTMTITSIAILFAAISVATTMTMVQADNESTDLDALFGPNSGTIGVTTNPKIGGAMEHFYSDIAASTAAAGFTPIGSLMGGYFDASEPGIQSGGASPFPVFIPGLILYSSASGPCVPVTPALDVYLGFEEGVFTFDALNLGQNYWVKVTQSEMDDFLVFSDPTCTTTPALETTFVSANTVPLGTVTALATGAQDQTITTTVGVGTADPTGSMTIGFNELFSWDPIGTGITGLCDPVFVAAIGCIGLEPGIRVEKIELILASQSTGFWKNHEDVVDTLTTGMLIDLLGDGTILINDDVGVDSDDIFQATKKTKGDARPQLAAQLLAAQLNVKNGSVSCTDATDAIAAAQAALIALGYDGTGAGTKPTGATTPSKADVNAIKDDLDDYNNNLLCTAP